VASATAVVAQRPAPVLWVALVVERWLSAAGRSRLAAARPRYPMPYRVL